METSYFSSTLAPAHKSYLRQLFSWCLVNDFYDLPSFLLPSFICSFIHYLYQNFNGYLIYYMDYIQYQHYFIATIVPALAIRRSFRLTLSFQHAPILFKALPYFLALQDIPGLFRIFSASVPSQLFLQGALAPCIGK